MPRIFFAVLGWTCLLSAPLVLALALPAPARDVAVPEPLRPWTAWVMERNPEAPCPQLPAQAGRLCAAYASLELDLGDQGGAFRQEVTVYGTQWVVLPGDPDAWPLEVASRGEDVPVVLREGRPQARLRGGAHVLSGRLAWDGMPGSLGVPPQLARVSLRLRGKPVASPEDGGSGRLLLESKAVKADSGAEAVPLVLRVYRKLVDGIPMRLETRIRLAVSGAEREIVTGRLLPEGATPTEIGGDLPARVEALGRLRMQLLPGDHEVRVSARFLDLPIRAAMERQDSLWPDEEIWTFEARPEIRVVELSGAPVIDPSQTGLPEEWKSLPAFRLGSGDTLRLNEKQRGDPNPQAGNLSLSRSMWLDFSGRGYTQKDVIRGELFRRTRLEMRPDFELGRAELNGSPVMITSSAGGAGVEVPAGPLDFMALSRAQRGGELAATGWARGFQSLNLRLNLPPGWRLFHAEGPDQVGESWVSSWSLWEVFLLCILTLAIFKLLGTGPALLAFATFLLLAQEPGLSGLIWLNLLASIGLCRVLPTGMLLRAANLYRLASFAVLVAVWIPFAVVHARKALYPQLDTPGGSAYGLDNFNLLDDANRAYGRNHEVRPTSAMLQMPAESGMAEDEQQAFPAPAQEEALSGQSANQDGGSSLIRRRGAGGAPKARRAPAVSEPQVYAKVQTGPGEPAWYWSTAVLNWSGPVSEGETLRLWLLPPWLWRTARALQAALPGILLLLLAGAGTGIAGGFRFPRPPFLRGAGAGLAFALLAGLAPARAEFPDSALLAELERRLTAAPECGGECLALNAATVALARDRFRVSLHFDAVDTAVAALPQAGQDQWSLESIRQDGKVGAAAARLPNGTLAAVIPPGRHRIDLEGRLLGNRLELAFGAETHNLTVEAPGFSVQGLSGSRVEGGTLVLQRREQAAASGTQGAGGSADMDSGARRVLTPDPILPFVEVHRTLSLGQEWFLDTRVVRSAPSAGAFAMEIPLLPFEHPLSAAMARDRDKTLVSFQEGQEEVSWRSAVDHGKRIRFAAGNLIRWSETWLVQASSRWHLEFHGPAPVQSGTGRGEYTEWQPIPGDTLRLDITEPKAASGPVKTIEFANLGLVPGRREGKGTLSLKYRAGQGDMANLTLPEGARLDLLNVNGRPQPLTQREGRLVLPLQPGIQNLELGWKQDGGIRLLQRTPRVILGDPAANVSLDLHVPADRWVLWVGGPSAGPALLLWGALVVFTAIAWGLGRARVTPLGFLDWALLFLGTSTVNLYAAAPFLVLLLALRAKEARAAAFSPVVYNLAQAVLALAALVAFGMLVASVPEGLLRAPDMQVTGNGSSSHLLRWFQDRSEGGLPVGWMFSVPLWVYRVVMLGWSLWLAFRLLRWLRWCWDRYASGGLWKPFTPEKPASQGMPPTA